MIPEQLLQRYEEMLKDYPTKCEPEPGTSYSHLRWMLSEIRSMATQIDPTTDLALKASRWLGFVQGILIERGITSVSDERDVSRPHFRTPLK